MLLDQPTVRRDYNAFMGAVDIADQYCGTYMAKHRPRNFFWRRVFDHCVFLALTNAYLLFRWWSDKCQADVREALDALDEGGLTNPEDKVPRGTASNMTRAEVSTIAARLKSIAPLVNDRAVWMRTMSAHLLSKCTRGSDHNEADRSPRTPKRTAGGQKWERVLKTVRKCNGKDCGADTRHACRCTWCTPEGVVLCKRCFNDKIRHRTARTNRTLRDGKARAKKPIPWETLSQNACAK